MPMVFGDISGVPAVGDADDDGLLEMAVHSESGIVHLFDLTGPSDCNVEWSMYGADPTHSSVYQGNGTPRGVGQDVAPALRFSTRWLPNPTSSDVLLELSLATAGSVGVTVFDAGGRVVWEREFEQSLPAGLHRIRWDLGRADGRRLPSGVYFAQVRSNDRIGRGRIIVTR